MGFHSTSKSFKYALTGLSTAYRNEPNFRIHLILAVIAILLGLVLNLELLEWLILTFTIFYVLTLELLNTSLEALVDLVSPEISPYAKIAKDVTAACVLLAAILSVIVAAVLFLPKILLLIRL